MDSLYELLESLDRPSIKYNEQFDGFEASEISSDGDSIRFKTRKISNKDVVPWLNQGGVISGSDENNCDIMRMVWVRRKIKTTIDPWEDEISKKNQDLVLENFGLNKASQLVAQGTLICLPIKYRHDLDKQCFALGMFGYTGMLVWTHDMITNRTKAVWWGDHNFLPFSLIRQVLESQKKLAGHPMFMALVAAICISQATKAPLEPICDKINLVENRTQHCPENLLTRPNVVGSYASLSAMMSGIATRLASFEGNIQTLREIHDSMIEYKWPSRVTKPEWAKTLVKEVEECVLILQKRLKSLEQRTRYLSQRADIQLTAVSHFSTALRARF